MKSVLFVISLTLVVGFVVAAPKAKISKDFKIINLCKVYGRNVTKMEECESCFGNVTDEGNTISNQTRSCILLLPPTFHACSKDKLPLECLKAKVKIFFRKRFHRFWKKWRDLFTDAERGHIHQVFAMKTLLAKVGNDSKENLAIVVESFSPCMNKSKLSSNETEGRTAGGLDVLDAAALEGSEDDELSNRIDRADDITDDDLDVDFKPDESFAVTSQPTQEEKEEDKKDEEAFKKKQKRLKRYMDKAFLVFQCKVNLIKENPKVIEIIKQSLKTYGDVVPAELLRAIFPIN